MRHHHVHHYDVDHDGEKKPAGWAFLRMDGDTDDEGDDGVCRPYYLKPLLWHELVYVAAVLRLLALLLTLPHCLLMCSSQMVIKDADVCRAKRLAGCMQH